MEGGRVGEGVGSWEERIYRILNLHFSGKMKRNVWRRSAVVPRACALGIKNSNDINDKKLQLGRIFIDKRRK